VRTALSWAWTAVPPTPSASACRPQCRRRSRPPPSPCSPVPLPAAPTATPSEVIAKGSSRSEGVWCVPRVKNRILRNRPRVFVSNFGDFVSVNVTIIACSRFIGHLERAGVLRLTGNIGSWQLRESFRKINELLA